MTEPHHEDAKNGEQILHPQRKTNYRTKREKKTTTVIAPLFFPGYTIEQKKNNTFKFNTNTEATIAHKQNLNLNQLNGTNEMLRMEINEKA